MDSMDTPYSLMIDTNECRSSRGGQPFPIPAFVVMCEHVVKGGEQLAEWYEKRSSSRPLADHIGSHVF
ncbi:hypothetical protein GCM10009555_069380 [Acrocarpospora macrocephala]|uniref:Uncharacterized protein n=1 Tax=Acrocarpospora macrocephala TaxID=150177 RepID=A0A5M3X304_9ACTN|nr:hypothetical protein Amac_097150 [Acrocarpospora macrocephala]